MTDETCEPMRLSLYASLAENELLSDEDNAAGTGALILWTGGNGCAAFLKIVDWCDGGASSLASLSVLGCRGREVTDTTLLRRFLRENVRKATMAKIMRKREPRTAAIITPGLMRPAGVREPRSLSSASPLPTAGWFPGDGWLLLMLFVACAMGDVAGDIDEDEDAGRGAAAPLKFAHLRFGIAGRFWQRHKPQMSAWMGSVWQR